MVDSKAAEALVPRFQYERTLNQDQAGRRTALYGRIDGQPAVLVLERAPFPASPDYLGTVTAHLGSLANLGANDVYFWFLASEGRRGENVKKSETSALSSSSSSPSSSSSTASLKINLIWPCTDQHVKKYSRQGVRYVTETPAVYHDHVRPYMQAQRADGRLNWVYNILEGRTEVEDVVYRTWPAAAADNNNKNDPPATPDDFLLLPDLNWDRQTVEALHLLGLVARRDLWSLRDLRRRDLPWLRRLRDRLLDATVRAYAHWHVERDQLKLYVHYQPTYYHFHVHVVHVQLEAGATQATGKAVGLDGLIEQLAHMGGGGNGDGDGDGDLGMDAVTLGYTLGEASELWRTVFGPLKEKEAEEKKTNQGTKQENDAVAC
ncbi:Scavenger mRNA decapping enzyme [Niveomyces insectorum RCEF 264]|uniref:Scavenger mRNA decapping enzyme n=1 Tax=Niveomyces insectorum RCEF 264 TaxID=1081102 RepID=A0A167MWQ6_9HYPO|nr:Scavenger mRNA decapping enzyme [Niveomyces insectorum RCEF 264]